MSQSDGPSFYYYEKIQVNTTKSQEILSRYSFDNFPKGMEKKVYLMQQFQNCLKRTALSKGREQTKQDEVRIAEGKNAWAKSALESVYVKRWIRTETAFLFELSNKVL